MFSNVAPRFKLHCRVRFPREKSAAQGHTARRRQNQHLDRGPGKPSPCASQQCPSGRMLFLGNAAQGPYPWVTQQFVAPRTEQGALLAFICVYCKEQEQAQEGVGYTPSSPTRSAPKYSVLLTVPPGVSPLACPGLRPRSFGSALQWGSEAAPSPGLWKPPVPSSTPGSSTCNWKARVLSSRMLGPLGTWLGHGSPSPLQTGSPPTAITKSAPSLGRQDPLGFSWFPHGAGSGVAGQTSSSLASGLRLRARFCLRGS